jgi:two-component system chemotaxis response regulator CheY
MDQRIRSKILIVDEDITVKLQVRDLFRELSFGKENIREAWDGEEGLKETVKTDFALILSGWRMPFMNGLAFLKAIRKEERTKSVPFILITGDEDRMNVGEAARAGASGFLPKPISAPDFTEKIRVVFKGTDDESSIRWERFSRRVRQV